MSYQVTRDGIATILKDLGYHEAAFSALEAPAKTQVHKGFNIRVESWEVGETLQDRVHALALFNTHLWWIPKQNSQKSYDLLAAGIEAILAKVLNPTNYPSGVRIIRWQLSGIEYDPERQIYEAILSTNVEYPITLT